MDKDNSGSLDKQEFEGKKRSVYRWLEKRGKGGKGGPEAIFSVEKYNRNSHDFISCFYFIL
jgi:hypothetical protein